MKKINICLGIFLALAISRFIPHPPNFTSLIALSFYIPAIFGIKYLPVLLASFFITDLFIGFHNSVVFTWGSVILIGLISKFFTTTLLKRISGSITGAFIFYIITNYGVWLTGSMYQNTLQGLLQSYVMAIPFFGYTIISTLIFSVLIETLYKFIKTKEYFKKSIN